MSISSPPLHEVSSTLAVGCLMTLAERVISYRYGLPNQLSSPLHEVSSALAVGCPMSLPVFFTYLCEVEQPDSSPQAFPG